jgi:Cu/Ag efflux protein CusF
MNRLLLVAALICANPACAATEWVQGQVVDLDPARSRIPLKHEPIKLVKMQAMTMHFRVKDGSVLAAAKMGDKVEFEVLEHDSELIIQQIEVRP